MSKVSELRHDVQRMITAPSVALQAETLTALMGSVLEYVTQVKEQEAMVKNIKTYQKQLKKGASTPEQEEELKEIPGLINEAKELKKTIKKKKQTLKQLRSQLKNILRAMK